MYIQEITTKHRAAIVIAVDQSLSMSEPIFSGFGRTVSKAEAAASAVNGLVRDLIVRASRDGAVRNYYDLALLGYSGEGVDGLVGGRRSFIPVSELEEYAVRTERLILERPSREGAVHFAEELMPVWVTPKASGATPMYEAMWNIRDLVRGWCTAPCNAESFPPVVINITDGQASDCDSRELSAIANDIKSLSTADGNVLLMNIHITADGSLHPLLFPTAGEVEASDDSYARLLAKCSSVMPAAFNGLIVSARGGEAESPYLAMGCNISAGGLLEMLDIGSQSVTGLR